MDRILTAAKFSGVEIAPFDADVVMSVTGLEQAVAFAMTTGPSARMLVNATEDVRMRVQEALRAALAPFLKERRLALKGATWVVAARAGV
jgi:hypothetical protein